MIVDKGPLDLVSVDPLAIWRLASGPRGASEALEQRELVARLRASRIPVFAVPNGGSRRGRREGALLASQGLEAGVPDLILPVPPRQGAGPVALEMKRADGGPRDVSELQWEWLVGLHAAGWTAIVGYGAADAIAKLRRIGYAIR